MKKVFVEFNKNDSGSQSGSRGGSSGDKGGERIPVDIGSPTVEKGEDSKPIIKK